MFSVRPIQCTDINQEFQFNDYLSLRVCSTLATSVIVILFLIISGFEATRLYVILLLYFLYSTDAFVDVFMGDLQQKGRMRVAGRMRACAYGMCAVVFTVTAVITRSIIIPLTISAIVNFVVYFIWIWVYRREFKGVRVKFNMVVKRKLILTLLPLFVSSTMYVFLQNANRYFLGFMDTDEAVAVITILLVPTSFLIILCTTLFQGAEMTKTAGLFTAGLLKQMSKRVNKQLLIATALSAFFILCSLSFGIPLLSWVYNTNLSMYKQEFILVTLSAVSFVYLAILGAASVTMRLQKLGLINMIAIAVITVPVTLFLVSKYGLLGAAYTKLVIFVPFTISTYAIYRIKLKQFMLSSTAKTGA